MRGCIGGRFLFFEGPLSVFFKEAGGKKPAQKKAEQMGPVIRATKLPNFAGGRSGGLKIMPFLLPPKTFSTGRLRMRELRIPAGTTTGRLSWPIARRRS